MSGIERIAAERRRQIEVEGWTAERDDEIHTGDQLALAAICYASPVEIFIEKKQNVRNSRNQLVGSRILFEDPWPWAPCWDKRDCSRGSPTEQRIRDLEKAGALIAAEIDRLERLAASERQ